MNKYRRFKYPFGGTGYVDPSNPTPDLQTILAYQDSLPVAKNTGGVQLVNDPSQYLQEYTERVRPEIERKVNEMNRRPSGNGRIIRNHDKLYDYYKDGDKLYYRKKGGKNWIDISDNDVAQKRINATIARNKRSYGKPKTSSDEYTPEEMRAQGFVQNNKGYWVRPQDLENSEIYDAGTLNNVVITGKKRNKSTNKSTPKTFKSRNGNPVTAINNSIFKNLYGNQERVNDVIRQGGAKSYKEYLNTPPAPTGYPKQAVIKQTPPKWRGR